MTQRQQPHDAGTFPACPDCKREPRHILDARRRPIGGHLMLCSCGETGKHESLDQAVSQWKRMHGIPLVHVRPAVVVSMPRAHAGKAVR